jgi:hypothetical protein
MLLQAIMAQKPRTKDSVAPIIPSPQQDDMAMEQHNSCVFTSDDEESVSEFSPFFSSLPSSPKLSPPTFSNSNGNDRSSPGHFPSLILIGMSTIMETT